MSLWKWISIRSNGDGDNGGAASGSFQVSLSEGHSRFSSSVGRARDAAVIHRHKLITPKLDAAGFHFCKVGAVKAIRLGLESSFVHFENRAIFETESSEFS